MRKITELKIGDKIFRASEHSDFIVRSDFFVRGKRINKALTPLQPALPRNNLLFRGATVEAFRGMDDDLIYTYTETLHAKPYVLVTDLVHNRKNMQVYYVAFDYKNEYEVVAEKTHYVATRV